MRIFGNKPMNRVQRNYKNEGFACTPLSATEIWQLQKMISASGGTQSRRVGIAREPRLLFRVSGPGTQEE
jgi:hypothetical protein